MNEERGGAAVQLGVKRFESFSRGGAGHYGRSYRRADHPELVHPAFQLLQRGVDMRKRNRDETFEAPRVALDQFGVQIVGLARGVNRGLLLVQIRKRRGDRQQLHLDACGIHHLEPLLQIAWIIAGQRPMRPGGRISVQAFHAFDVGPGKIVRVNIDSHRSPSAILQCMRLQRCPTLLRQGGNATLIRDFPVLTLRCQLVV